MQPIDWIYRAASLYRDQIAVEAPEISLSYEALVHRVDALASELQQRLSNERTRIGVCAHNTVEHVIAILGIMASGHVWVPLNPRDASAELEAKIAVARPSLIIVDEECLGLVEHSGIPLLIGKTGDRSACSMTALIDDALGKSPRRVPINGDQTQALKFTGGSSGTPKGVLQPYRAWIAGAINMLHAFRFDASDRFLLAAPLTHGTSCYLTPVLAAGGTLVLLGERTTPEAVLESFEHRRVSATFLPPTLIYMLMQRIQSGPVSFDALRLLIYGAAPMSADRVREAQSLFGSVIAANYGLTEAPQIITALRSMEAEGQRVASAGRAGLMTRVEILGPDGEFLPPHASGEVVVSGDLIMTGYLDVPHQTGEALRNGWLRTGDLGHLDEQGFLFITDRIKDMIISGGFNVFPGEVERALAAHPSVNECVVFGLEDTKWGEAVHAAVTLRNGENPDAARLVEFAKQKVGSIKAPKRIHFMDDLPRSSVGKVQRRRVRELIAETYKDRN